MTSDTTGSRAWANPGYVLDQLTKALETASKHTDRETRERAAVKVGRWRSIFQGMLSGALLPGERTPIAGVPAWVTPRVVQGGFATGEFMAGGPVQPHETLLAARLGIRSIRTRTTYGGRPMPGFSRRKAGRSYRNCSPMAAIASRCRRRAPCSP
jgi:hypothetical protein